MELVKTNKKSKNIIVDGAKCKIVHVDPKIKIHIYTCNYISISNYSPSYSHNFSACGYSLCRTYGDYNNSGSNSDNVLSLEEYIDIYQNNRNSICLKCFNIVRNSVLTSFDLYKRYFQSIGGNIEDIEFWELFKIYREKCEMYNEKEVENQKYKQEIERYKDEIEKNNIKIRRLEGSFDIKSKDSSLLEID